ncbi:MAG: phosphate ABC transporter permease PstA [Pseudomonadota bacterium]
MNNFSSRPVRRRVMSRLPSRHRRDRLLKVAGLAALLTGLGFVAALFSSIAVKGYTAFAQTHVELDVTLDPELLGATIGYDVQTANFDAIVRRSLSDAFPTASTRAERRELSRLVSIDAANQVRNMLDANPGLTGEGASVWVPASSSVDMLVKEKIDRALPEALRPVSDRQLAWVDELDAEGRIALRFNSALFRNGDSREPELAGIRGAVSGSFLMLVITVIVAFPVGVAAAVYLEEFAPRNRWADLVEVNINNLAAVPSIVYGLLGLSIFIDWMALPRSAPLVGGLVLAVLTLPVIIIASRSSIKAVPPSIREAALALGASKIQVLFHHLLPQAMPGILTGTIIGMSRALGETAPLLMIGMVAFIVDVPSGFTDPATALPVQVYLWADSPELAFAEKTAAAILVLLVFLMAMNLTAIVLRKRLETRY